MTYFLTVNAEAARRPAGGCRPRLARPRFVDGLTSPGFRGHGAGFWVGVNRLSMARRDETVGLVERMMTAESLQPAAFTPVCFAGGLPDLPVGRLTRVA